MKNIIGLILALSIGGLSTSASEVIKGCADCHGENGISTEADIPTIAGASEAYLSDTMLAYKEGIRIAIESKYRDGELTRPPTDMHKIAKNLNDDQIQEIAIFFSTQKFIPAKQKFDEKLVSTGESIHAVHCQKCHEDGGSSADDDAGILAGQHTTYLKEAFTLYRSGQRVMEEKMKVKIDKLTDEDVDALLSYYASQQ